MSGNMESELELLRIQVATLQEAVKTLHERVLNAERHIAEHGKTSNQAIGVITTLVGGLVQQLNQQEERRINATYTGWMKRLWGGK